MSDPPKLNFSFGQPAGGSGSSPFGKPASTTQAPSGGLFGSASNPSAPASSGTLFGGGTPATSAGGGGLFGSGATSNPGGNIFGGGNKTSSGAFSFGQPSSSNAPNSGLFGSTFNMSQPSQSSNAPGTSAAPAFATPSKPSELSSQNETPKQPFGGATSQGSNPFGIPASTTASTTPISKPSTSIFANSTTPAGPPPSTSVSASSSSLFTLPKPQGQQNSSLFSKTTQPSSNVTTAPATTSAAPSVLDAGNKGGFDLFANKGKQPPGTGLFQNLNQQSDGKAEKKANSFPSTSQTQASGLQSQASAAGSSAPFFPPTTTSASSTTPTTTAFSLGGKPAASTGAATAATNASSSGLFSPAKTQDNTLNATASSSSAPQASNMFAGLGKFSAPKETAPTATANADTNLKANETNQSQSTTLNTSTAGPAPPAVSRLKNKSMDDIITRWATDLSKYKKEFQAQAEKVARWDRMLVDNSEKIQKLYGQTLQAERATTEVERQLTAVENDQAELESWLDHYEKEIDGMVKQRGDNEPATGPDAERQRTYQLAGRLTERLDDMGKDLTSMIEEINDSSSSLNKNSKKDDPLSQVVQVLNSHLLQLQQIDQGAAALTQKVQEAQKQARSFRPASSGGSIVGGASSDAADGFWRSYMGRR